ncbi:MAG: Rossmann fold domain-containing protein [Novosphingobium sp.]
MARFEVGPLPDDPLAAATLFHAEVLPGILRVLDPARHGEDRFSLTLVFPLADHTHRAWRLAAVQSLARAWAPQRINGLVSDDERAIAAADRFLAGAQGVTGQLLVLDGKDAGEMLS